MSILATVEEFAPPEEAEHAAAHHLLKPLDVPGAVFAAIDFILLPVDTSDAALAQYLFYGVTSVLQLGGTGASTDAIRALRERRAAGTLEAPYIYGTGGHLTLHGTHSIYTLFPQAVRDAADSIAAATAFEEPANLYSLGIGVSFVRKTIEYMRVRSFMGRFRRAEEVAEVIAFLASDRASFVTGQTYDVSGGRCTY